MRSTQAGSSPQETPLVLGMPTTGLCNSQCSEQDQPRAFRRGTWQQPRCSQSQSSVTSVQLLISLSSLPELCRVPAAEVCQMCVCDAKFIMPLCHAGLRLTNPLQTKLTGSVVVMQILSSYFRRMIPLSVLLLLLSRSDTANLLYQRLKGKLHWLAALCLEISTQLIIAWL